MRGLGIGSLGVVVAALAGAATAQVTQRVSVNSIGTEGNGSSIFPSTSPDGRFVAFSSWANNLAPDDPNTALDLYVRDRQRGTTELVSVSIGGGPGNNQSYDASISDGGRFVAFYSTASNLVVGDVNGQGDVFVRDRLTDTTTLVSVSSLRAQASAGASEPSISANGRFVAFVSSSPDLVPGDDADGLPNVFVRDRLSGTTECVSVVPNGVQPGTGVVDAVISADGRYVAFATYMDRIVPGDTDGLTDIFVRDRQTGALECVNLSANGVQGSRWSYSPSISANGRFVAFTSLANNLVPGDTNDTDVFVRDRQLDTIERVSVSSFGLQANAPSYGSRISSDGRFVAFYSEATNLVPGDTNASQDTFVFDRQSDSIERVSVDSSGEQSNGGAAGYQPSISSDGGIVAFDTSATNLVPDDTNGTFTIDVFVHDQAHGDCPSACEPGVAGVRACPCGNPPTGPGRGCDNSSGTGGARLGVSGGAYLSSDSVVLTMNGGKPTALSVVMQGSASIPAGAVYGQGVRCIGGALKRLYSKTAAGGSISAPNFGAGDPPVHARSAAMGDPITAGETRWYMVYYRDGTVLGGCAPESTFNATQARTVSWQP